MKNAVRIGMLLSLCVLAPPAAAQSGWILVVPPVDEAKAKAVREDREVQQRARASYDDAIRIVIRRLIAKDTAPLSEWTQWAAYDLAAECEAGRATEWQAHRTTHRYLAAQTTPGTARTDALAEEARLGTLIELGRLDAGRCVPASVVYGPSR